MTKIINEIERKGASYDTLMPLLMAMLKDFEELSKKKPEARLSVAKVTLVNRLLKDVLVILDSEQNRAYLDLLDEEEVPDNSDVLLMLGQTVAAMKAFKLRYFWSKGLGDTASWRSPK